MCFQLGTQKLQLLVLCYLQVIPFSAFAGTCILEVKNLFKGKCICFIGGGSDSGERSLKPSVDALGDSEKQEGKKQHELIHWHNR